ncbi:hypothetical protein BJY01DRAFT_245203 [Aspergillus pseudoustus]|uniref:Heterokaryon incompatibility domain-containing protein n=1 Tax=Aspergillus pseudoustus TaxID=1810923 RepID=A0ABR4KFQ6_9EURO
MSDGVVEYGPVREPRRDHGYPLSTLMEVLYGEDMGMGDGYCTCFAYLYRMALELGEVDSVVGFQDTMITALNDDRVERLRLHMTPGQHRSLCILWRWWGIRARECVAGGDERVGEDDRDKQEGSDDDEAQFYGSMMVVKHTVHEACGIRYIFRDDSIYNTCIQSLFNAEFGNFVIHRHGKLLTDQRRGCAQDVACMSIALEACGPRAGASATEIFTAENYLAGRWASDSAWRSGIRILGNRDRAGLDPRCTSGSSIASCSWLETVNGWPLYLWDTKERKVVNAIVLATDHGFDISYTAISHTWGRWRQNDRPGVDLKPNVPWLIPRNDLFDVGQLGDILADMPTHTRYIWFDLVCIPQSGCGEELTDELRQDQINEIASQASIFKSAKHVITWWNTHDAPERWDGIRSAIKWMSGIYLDKQFSDFDKQPLRLPSCNTIPGTGLLSPDLTTLLPWFSSLWTLQEVCLRPDMWICNKRLELLTVNDDGSGALVAFNTIVSLSEIVKHTLTGALDHDGLTAAQLLESWKSHPQIHSGFQQILTLLHRTGMDGLHRLEREEILFLATSRYCTDSRAEAIMSVIGVVDWYKVSNSHQSDREKAQSTTTAFIFNQYPLAFVQEVAQELGSSFFTAIIENYPPPPTDIHDSQESDDYTVRGSMLPFRASPSERRRRPFPLHDALDHPSVATWSVRADGTVFVPEVEILFSSDSKPTDILYMKCLFDLSLPLPANLVERHGLRQVPGDSRYYGDLRYWIKNIIPKIYGQRALYFAIHLRYLPGGWEGLLLKTVSGDQEERMVKIGNLHVLTSQEGSEYLPRREPVGVNWVVV